MTSWPATSIVPLRAGPVAGAAENVTVPAPKPGVPPVSVIHDALLFAPHPHPSGACTETLPLPPAGGTDSASGATVYEQPAVCVTVTVWPATTSVPVLVGAVTAAPSGRRRSQQTIDRVALRLGRSCVEEVEIHAGSVATCGGQWLDLAAEGRDLTTAQLAGIHRGKTGALIRACCELGGMAAGASPVQIAALTGFGQEVGLAFQVADDVLDATGSSAELGKTAGRDALLAKSTYVSLLGVEGARAEAERLVALAIARLQHSDLEAEPLSDLAGFIITRTN